MRISTIACERELSRSVSELILQRIDLHVPRSNNAIHLGGRPCTVMERSHLFRTRVDQFKRCEYRKPALSELRSIYRGTNIEVAL